ncbi:MAG: transposase [Omnitrophica WOR_2 bacterium GWF2_43_52]|nr:MAG: transposase [Omnitrophica WOR_2 bacterium GWA2_44_7]OGX21864.1 MAG: transposase [Omnitrophica WOR_2 bacterium GWF2_43_52]OGX58838.1 MAG: transposase [Omnitrophica WOR_2 bacterium RIFOXYC2_FULL_43_9]HAH20199.1 transposase [Candidatus Omnitrophota bacterium]HBG63021.1 transposase [Candidatus Omnitrophota bacterium]
MARLARIVAPGTPHHVLQRGNRSQQVFFSDSDRRHYLDLLKEQCGIWGVKVWAYCLMDNHVHLILVPEEKGSLGKSLGETHKKYTRMINFRKGWRGYLWQGRFKSYILDERYLYAAVRYVERNPVRAKIVKKAQDYRWSSARSHVYKEKDELLSDFYLLRELADWSAYLAEEDKPDDLKLMRYHGQVRRPLGNSEFLERLARKLGVEVRTKKPGPKPKRELSIQN